MTNFQLSQFVGSELGLPHKAGQFIVNSEGTESKPAYPDYSTDMNTAWQLVDIMNEKGCSWSMGGGGDLTTFSIYSNGRYYSHSSSHAPTAILRAIVDALWVLDEN